MGENNVHFQGARELNDVFDLIDQLFPFHFIFDVDLNFLQIGKGVKKIDEECKEGNFMLNHIQVFSDIEEVTFHHLMQKGGRVFLISFVNKAVKLKGQLLPYKKEGYIIFVGNPMVGNGSFLLKNNISLVDFAHFDTTPDYLLSKKAQETSLREIQQLVKILQNSKTKLEQSNNELKQFAYIASHDLQSPLRTVISFAQLLEKKYKNDIDPMGKEYLDFIISGTRRMQKLINDLLEYSKVRQEVSHFQGVNIEEIIEGVKIDLNHDISINEARIESFNMPRIYANPTLIQQLFQNLISNSLKFRQLDPPVIKIYCEEKEDEWLFIVEDNGIGFNMEDGKKIFQIFQRAVSAQAYEGTGIGLAICKRVVEAHKGEIWVKSQLMKGTVFSFTINKFLSTRYP